MARFDDLLNSLGPSADGVGIAYPETFDADLRTAYADDMAAPAAKIAVLEADLAAANEKILLLQAHNYELITAAPVAEPGTPVEGEGEGDGDGAGDGVEEENDENSGVQSLFTKKESE